MRQDVRQVIEDLGLTETHQKALMMAPRYAQFFEDGIADDLDNKGGVVTAVMIRRKREADIDELERVVDIVDARVRRRLQPS